MAAAPERFKFPRPSTTVRLGIVPHGSRLQCLSGRIVAAVVGRESLCPRCGTSEYERISDTESRCANCGLGRTQSTLRVQPVEPGPLTHEQDLMRRLDERAGQRQHAFSNAGFFPLGLDRQWSGARWVGGWGTSGAEITDLTLAHGDDPFDQTQPQVRIVTCRPRLIGGTVRDPALEWVLLARTQLQYLHQRAGPLPDDIRLAAFDGEGRAADPTAPWGTETRSVDGESVNLKTFAMDGDWVGLARYKDLLVGIDAHDWPLAATDLIEVADFAVYEAGSRELESRRMRDKG